MNPHANARANPLAMCASFWRNRELLSQLTKRDVIGRYRGSLVGIAWSFFNPLLMLCIYTFVFSVVFDAKWGGVEGSRASFALAMFLGMVIHGILAECVTRAPGLILGNANYVKRVVFPLEVLPWMALGSAVFHALVSLAVLVAAQLLVGNPIGPTALLLPLVIAPILPVSIGVAWMLASIGVYIRDVTQVTGLFVTALMFLAPVFYPVTAVPEAFRKWIFLNPLTFIIEQSRAVFFDGRLPDWPGLAAYTAGAIAFAYAGFWWFQRTRRGFADVI